MYEKPLFKINEYDRDGDISEEGVYLCFGKTTINVADSIEGFTKFIIYLQKIEKEIENNY